jgi:hypothetical protein
VGVYKPAASVTTTSTTTTNNNNTTTVDVVQHLVMPTIQSYHPLHQVTCGAMDFEVIPLCANYWDVFGSLMVLASYLQDAWMLVALSE